MAEAGPIQVACASNDAYAPHAAAMLHSVLAGTPAETEFHMLHGTRLSAPTRNRLARFVDRHGASLRFVPVPDSAVEGLPTRKLRDPSTWYRILLPELLPGLDRVIHIDADTIAMDSLMPLWQTDLAGNCLAAVTNVFEPHHREHPARIGLARETDYFNAGVALMDLETMRREDVTADLRAYGLANPEICFFFDQEPLNVVLSDRRLVLHPRWNTMNSFWLFPWAGEILGAEALAEAQRAPAIRHFEGPGANKPWHFDCSHPLRRVYRPHRLRTPWPVYRPAGMTPRAVLDRVRRAAGPRPAASMP